MDLPAPTENRGGEVTEVSVPEEECHTYTQTDRGVMTFFHKVTHLVQSVENKLRTQKHVEGGISEIPESFATTINATETTDETKHSFQKLLSPVYHGSTGSGSQTISESHFVYDFSHAKRGIAVLIVYTKFQDGSPNRECAEYDIRHMRAMFKSLGFVVIVLKDQHDLMTRLQEIRNDMEEDSDCFACLISSHGVELQTTARGRVHYIYTTSGKVETASIIREFDNEHCYKLKGKPKLFFIQACRSKPRAVLIDAGVEVCVFKDTDYLHRDKGRSDVVDGLRRCDQIPSIIYIDDNPEEKPNIVQLQASSRHTDKLFTASADGVIEENDQTLCTRPNTKYLHDDKYVNKEHRVPPQFNFLDDSNIEKGLKAKRREHFKTPLHYHDDSNCLLTSRHFRVVEHELRYENIDHSKRKNEKQNHPIVNKHELKERNTWQSDSHHTGNQTLRQNLTPHHSKVQGRPRENKQRQTTHISRHITQHDIEECPEFFDVPCPDDCLVMFSSVSENVAYLDDIVRGERVGGWLPYCMYKVISTLNKDGFNTDLLEALTKVTGKMALEMETRSLDKMYNRTKSVACIYHRLTKDVFLTRKDALA